MVAEAPTSREVTSSTPLDEACDFCDGTGKHLDYADRHCAQCSGSGRIPTKEGLELLSFISRNFGWGRK